MLLKYESDTGLIRTDSAEVPLEELLRLELPDWAWEYVLHAMAAPDRWHTLEAGRCSHA